MNKSVEKTKNIIMRRSNFDGMTKVTVMIDNKESDDTIDNPMGQTVGMEVILQLNCKPKLIKI